MFGRATDLSTRAEQQTLPGTKDATRFRDLLLAEAHDDTWRIVEVFSVGGGPFQAELAWSAGCGVGAHARITVAHAARVGIYARSVRVRARNLGAEANPVGVTIADGQAQTRNQWEATGDVSNGLPAIVAVPPFARAVRLDLAEPSAAGATELWLVDGGNVLRARVPAADQPGGGVLVGGAREVHIVTTTKSAFRLVFDLTL